MKARLAMFAGSVLLGSIGSPVPSADPACPQPYPGGVLECLKTAYAARDTALYAAVLAPDFHYTGTDGAQVWDRAEDVRGTGLLFMSAHSVAFEITGPITVMEGAAPGIWILEKVASSLTVVIDTAEGQTEWRVENLSTMTVREVSGDQPGFELLEWRQVEEK